MKLRATDATLL